LDGRLGATRGLLEADLEVVAQVRALLRPAASAAAPEQIAQAEGIAESAEMSSKPTNVDGSIPPLAPLTPAWPNRSYAARFCGSERTA
jgi:hypothetical protein